MALSLGKYAKSPSMCPTDYLIGSILKLAQ